MKNALVSIIFSSFVLVGCSQYDCNTIETDRTQISSDGKIKVETGVNGDVLKLKLTNVSAEEIAIDKEMEFFTSFSLTGNDGKRIIPGVLYDKDIHKDVQCTESYFDENFDEKQVDLSTTIATLKPGDSLCKIYHSNQFVNEYRVAFSFEGASSIYRYAWRFPNLNDVTKVSVKYDANSWNADIFTIIANQTNQNVPENLYQGKIQIDWEQECKHHPQNQETPKAGQ